MAKPGSKAAKKRDPRRPDEWPVDKYPYVYEVQYGVPSYHENLKAAQKKALADLEKMAEQFKHLDSAIVTALEATAEEVRQLDEAGGSVARVIDTRAGVWYRAQISRRPEA